VADSVSPILLLSAVSDPYHQYGATEAAYGHGIIGRAEVAALVARKHVCQQSLLSGRRDVLVPGCYRLLDDVVQNSLGSKSEYMVSIYDARKTDLKRSARVFPPGHQVVEAYLGGWPLAGDSGKLSVDISSQVLEAIHADSAASAGQRYQECSGPPYLALSNQDGLGVVDDIIAILEHKDRIRLLFFNGVEDLVCNHVGNEIMLENLQWTHRQDWIEANRYAWRAQSEDVSKVSGYMKEYGNLSFLKGTDFWKMARIYMILLTCL
jgi:carboxypeptidase D